MAQNKSYRFAMPETAPTAAARNLDSTTAVALAGTPPTMAFAPHCAGLRRPY